MLWCKTSMEKYIYETRTIAATTKAPSEEAKPITSPEAADKRPNLRSRRRKSKEGVQEAGGKDSENALLDLPSVPSTKHIAPLDIHVASFFSQHRPMSVSHVIPPVTTPQAFSSLFDPPKASAKSKLADVIYTLSSAVDASGQASSQQQGRSPEEFDLRAAVTQASTSHADDTTQHLDLPTKTLHINLQELARRFRPFVPPPPPVPLGAMREAAKQASREAKEQQTPKHTTWTSTLTIYESTHSNGEKTFKTYATPIIRTPTKSSHRPPNVRELEIVREVDLHEDQRRNARYVLPAPRAQPFLGRMRERQLRYVDRMDERFDWGVMQMISVKRQRRLKMKKHKYKKLMKRTKNLRRRLDRT
ncbi:MAG: hypothetical protein Q9217_002967 [Psora testacea]